MTTPIQLGKSLLTNCYTVLLVLFRAVISLLCISWTKVQRNCTKFWHYFSWNCRMSCESCIAYFQSKDHVIEELRDEKEKDRIEIWNLQKEVQRLKSDKKYLTDQNEEQEEMISKQLAKDVERNTKGKCHNASDNQQPETICSDMYDEEWRLAMEVLKDHDEIVGIRFLSKILEECQSFCRAKAKEQLASFLNPFETDHLRETVNSTQVIISDDDLQNLYKIRRNASVQEGVKSSLRQAFKDKCLATDEFRSIFDLYQNDSNSTEYLESYISGCCDLSWQCAIADPPVTLEFGVKNKPKQEIEDKFIEYCQSTPIKEASVKERDKHNTVMQVVWPACIVRWDNGSEKLIGNAKGFVILYDGSTEV